MLRASETHDTPTDLINIALEVLKQHHAELPAFSTLDRLARRIRSLANARIAALLHGRLTATDQARLLALLESTPGHPRTHYNDLKRIARRPSHHHFAELLDHLAWLESLGTLAPVLVDITPRKIQHLAAEAKALDASEVAALTLPRKLLLIVCHIHHAQATTRDALVEMFIKRMATFQKVARAELEQIQRSHQLETERMLGTLRALLDVLEDEVSAAELANRLTAALAPAGGRAHVRARCEVLAAAASNNHLPLVWHAYRSHRSLWFRMLEALTFTATNQDTTLIAALAFLQANRQRTARLLPVTLDLAFAPEQWQRIVVTRQDGEQWLIRQHLEASIFTCLAAELKSGDVAVTGSHAYTDYRDQLIPWVPDAPEVVAYCRELGLPATATAFVADLKARLTQASARVDQRFPDDHQLAITAAGEPTLKRPPRQEPSATARALERTLLERMTERHLIDILANAVRYTNCSRHFEPPAGTEPRSQDPHTDYIHLLFTYGTTLGPAQAARHLRGAISAHTLSYLNRRHITSAKLNAAQVDLINVYHDLTLPRLWGDGTRAAADGTALELLENNPLAEYHFRYQMRGGIAYHHVADTYIAIFSHFIPCGVWEAVYIIEGLLQNRSDIQPRTVHADTQGQSTPVFALAHLLGIELLPRIRNWQDLVFFKADPDVIYQHIEPLFGERSQAIDWDVIERHWPDLLQVVLAIRAGKITSATILRKLGNESRKNRLYQVFRELGRVIRTIFLLRYVIDPPMRAQITASTNKVEAYNGFSSWLSFGSEGLLKDLDPEEAEKLVKYRDVLANAVIMQTTIDMTVVLKHLIDEGYPVHPEDVAALSPYLTNHIKRFGEYVLSDTELPALDAIRGWQFPTTTPTGGNTSVIDARETR